MKEYENPQFADFLRMLGGIIAAAQASGELDAAIPAHVAARMIFGVLDELALAWVLAKQPFGGGSAWCASEEVRYRPRRRLGHHTRHDRSRTPRRSRT